MRRLVDAATFQVAESGTVGPVRVINLPGGPIVIGSINGGTDGVFSWSADTGQLRNVLSDDLPGTCSLTHAAMPDGTIRLFVATESGVDAWDLATGRRADGFDFRYQSEVWSVATGNLPNGNTVVAAAGSDNEVILLDAATGRLLMPTIVVGDDTKKAVSFIADAQGKAKIIAFAGDAGVVYRWDLASGERLSNLAADPSEIIFSLDTVNSSHRGSLLIAGDSGGAVYRWDAFSGERVGVPIRNDAYLTTLSATEGAGRSLIFASDVEEKVVCWDAVTGDAVVLSISGVSISTARNEQGSVLVAAGNFGGGISVGRF